MMYFGANEKDVLTLPHIAQRKHTFLGKIKEMSKTKELSSRNKIALELLHLILGHRYTISLLAGDTDNVWEDIELRINTYPFCTSCHISFMNKNDRSKNTLKPKTPFKWVLMVITPSTVPKILSTDTTFSNYILIVDAYYTILKLYSMEKIA